MPLFNVFNNFCYFLNILRYRLKRIQSDIFKTNSRLSTLVLSNLRRFRELTDTLEGHKSKTMSHKNLMRLQFELP